MMCKVVYLCLNQTGVYMCIFLTCVYVHILKRNFSANEGKQFILNEDIKPERVLLRD